MRSPLALESPASTGPSLLSTSSVPGVCDKEAGQMWELERLVEEEEISVRPVALEPLPSDLSAGQEMAVLVSLALDSLSKSVHMPARLDALLCEAWLAMHSPFAVQESRTHPYPKDTQESGSVHFPEVGQTKRGPAGSGRQVLGKLGRDQEAA